MRTSLASDSKEVNSRLLHDHYNTIIFKSNKNLDIYLVGGFIRDVFVNRDGLDRDFIIKGRHQAFLKRIARSLNGKVISIGKRDLKRLVLRNGLRIDFSPFKKTVSHDLSQRDFTINALAWSPETGFIDVHNGLQDLSKKTIRMIHEKNMKADPIRILRAYRFAAELSFNLDFVTRNALKRLNNMMKRTTSERITLEFWKILNVENPAAILKTMLEDGIFQQIISLSNSELQERIEDICMLNRVFDNLHLRYKLNLEKIFSQNLLFKGLLRAEILLRGFPQNKLSLSSKIIKRINRLDSIKMPESSGRGIKADELYDIFKKADDAALDYLIINCLADYTPELERYNEIKKRGLLTAEDIIDNSGIEKGVLLGRAIDLIRRAEFRGIISCRAEAVRFTKENFKSYLT